MPKYNNKKVEADGYKFDSKREYQRYCELKLMNKAKRIKGLMVHPKFLLLEGFKIGKKRFQPMYYIADFSYEQNGVFVVEDVKGVRTEAFNLKAKLFASKYGFEIRIVR